MDPELYERARLSIAAAHGLREVDAHRLVGESAEELHRDARAMAKELNVFDPTERARDGSGRYTGHENRAVNDAIRAAAGR